MSIVKRIVSAGLSAAVVISAFSASVTAYADEPDVQTSNAAFRSFWADGNPNVNSENQSSVDVVRWFASSDQGKNVNDITNSSDRYYLFLPSTADLDNLTVWHNFTSAPSVNGVEIVSGEPTSVFAAEGDYTMNIDNDTVTLTVMKSDSVGTVCINTESGDMNYVHADKENKESGNILVVQADGTVDYDNVLAQIKGRGNTTWTNMEKKPYNIKLDKKASLLGMDKSKKWCLLANGQDHSLIRNKVAYDLANELDMEYSPDSGYVNLYLNNEYVGVYQLTEKVEVGDNNLVKINDLQTATEELNDQALDSYEYNSGRKKAGSMKYFNIPNNPEDITGGYLLEYEVESKYQDELCGFITSGGQHVVLKGPEIASKEQVQYIKSFVQDMEDAIYSEDGYNSKGKHYTEYIDTESAALMYLIQELSVNIDCGITSCFFYKESDSLGDGKIHASPVWDFDVAFGNLTNEKDGVSMMSTDKWFAENSYTYGSSAGGSRKTVFAKLCEHEDFRKTVKRLYYSKFLPALDIINGTSKDAGKYLKSADEYKSELNTSADMNFLRWRIEDNLLVSSAGTTFDSQMSYLKNFLSARTDFLTTGMETFAPDDEVLTYKLGDVDGDGGISTKDGFMMLRAANGTVQLDEKQTLAADIDSNGKIAMNDVVYLMRFTSAYDVPYHIGRDFTYIPSAS